MFHTHPLRARVLACETRVVETPGVCAGQPWGRGTVAIPAKPGLSRPLRPRPLSPTPALRAQEQTHQPSASANTAALKPPNQSELGREEEDPPPRFCPNCGPRISLREARVRDVCSPAWNEPTPSRLEPRG